MNINTLPFATCFVLLSISCRQKGEQKASNTIEKAALKSHVRVATKNKDNISDFQKKRIRSTVQSAGDASQKDKEKSIQAYEQLLQIYPSDLKFLHELVLESRKAATTETQLALVSAIARMYRAGEYVRLGELMDAIKTDGGGILVNLFTDELIKQKDLIVGAYEELLVNPSKDTHPDFYDNIAFGAGRILGYPEALARIPNISDEWFGTVSARNIIRNWTNIEPVAASTYVRDMPDSEFRNGMLVSMIEEVARTEDYEMARAWANYLGGDERIRALGIVEREQAIVRRRNEERAKRASEK